MRCSRPAPLKSRFRSCAFPDRLNCRSLRKNWPPAGDSIPSFALAAFCAGETSHYDVVVSETARGIQLAQLDTGVPLIFCVLTCDTLEQAIDRAGLKSGNKGYEAGLAAVEMGQLMRKLGGGTAKTASGAKRKARRG